MALTSLSSTLQYSYIFTEHISHSFGFQLELLSPVSSHQSFLPLHLSRIILALFSRLNDHTQEKPDAQNDSEKGADVLEAV